MALDAHLAELSEKHRLLQRRIEEEMARPSVDEVRVRRWKQEKLKLKDQIEKLRALPPRKPVKPEIDIRA
ncbi:MAG TPA: DUF465 domain-containing protein [Hyphomicrobiaceae bacterium]|nr:DUF465 domain-containing protein [Hyphomicrobiaceae bacterium]